MPRLLLLLLLPACSDTHVAAKVYQHVRVDTTWIVINARGEQLTTRAPVVLGDSVTGFWYDR